MHQSPVLPTSGGVLVKSRSPLETAATITSTQAYTPSQLSVTEQAEAPEPPASPTCTFKLQHRNDTEGLRPAAALVSKKTQIKNTLTTLVAA